MIRTESSYRQTDVALFHTVYGVDVAQHAIRALAKRGIGINGLTVCGFRGSLGDGGTVARAVLNDNGEEGGDILPGMLAGGCVRECGARGGGEGTDAGGQHDVEARSHASIRGKIEDIL